MHITKTCIECHIWQVLSDWPQLVLLMTLLSHHRRMASAGHPEISAEHDSLASGKQAALIRTQVIHMSCLDLLMPPMLVLHCHQICPVPDCDPARKRSSVELAS